MEVEIGLIFGTSVHHSQCIKPIAFVWQSKVGHLDEHRSSCMLMKGAQVSYEVNGKSAGT